MCYTQEELARMRDFVVASGGTGVLDLVADGWRGRTPRGCDVYVHHPSTGGIEFAYTTCSKVLRRATRGMAREYADVHPGACMICVMRNAEFWNARDGMENAQCQ